MNLPKDDAAVLSARWIEGVLLKRDVFSTVERGRFSGDNGEVVVADAGTMQPSQGLFGGAKIGDVAGWLDQMQRHPVDETAHQRLPAGPQQYGCDIQITRDSQGAPFTPEQMARDEIRPPGHPIDPAQDRVDFAIRVAEAATLNGREHVAFEKNAFGPLRRQDCGVVSWQAHDIHAAAASRK